MVDRLKIYILAYLFFLISTSILIDYVMLNFAFQTALARALTQSSLNYAELVSNINLENVKRNIQIFSNFGSRYTGYPGCEEAAMYIREKFSEYGLTVRFENFTILVPVGDASLTVLSSEEGTFNETFRVFPLVPNNVETCATPIEGIEGNLVYVRSGELNEFNNKPIEGNIVLMDWSSKNNWLNAMTLGAKAVVFLEPFGYAYNFDNGGKSINMPINFPRVLVSGEDATRLLYLVSRGDVRVRLVSNMLWEERIGSNIIGVLNGTDPEKADKILVFTAYYDSRSVVPAISPGAQEAVGISALLELARILSQPQFCPKWTVWFVAFAGHSQALWGAREFTERHFNEIGSKILLLANLALNTETDIISLHHMSDFYRAEMTGSRYDWIWKRISTVYKPQIESQLGMTFIVYNGFTIDSSWDYAPTSFTIDSEPFNLAGGVAFSFFTTYSYRYIIGTPWDTCSKITQKEFNNLDKQMKFVFSSIYGLVNEESIEPHVTPIRWDIKIGGFCTLYGQVLTYDKKIAWYKPVPHALVYIECRESGSPLHSWVLRADENGSFVWHGAIPMESHLQGRIRGLSYLVYAYVKDDPRGPITMAPDFGMYGLAKYPFNFVIIDRDAKFSLTVVFNCSAILTYNFIEPRSIGTYGEFGLLQGAGSFQINDFTTHTDPESYSYIIEPTGPGIALFFVPPNKPIEILFRMVGDPLPVVLLINSTENNPRGFGIQIPPLQKIDLSMLVTSAENFYYLSVSRINILKKYGITDPQLLSLVQRVEQDINLSKIALETYNYGRHLFTAYTSLYYSREIYLRSLALISDTVSATVFSFIILIPFSILLEMLIFKSSGPRRASFIVLIFALFVFVLYLFHPGFHLAENILVVVLGFSICVMIIPAYVIAAGWLLTIFRELRTKLIGLHFADISRTSAFISALSLGVQNMRRRKFRTILNLTLVVLITFSLVALLSAPSMTYTKKFEYSGTTLYQGVYIRSPYWLTIDPKILDLIQAKYGEEAVVCPRSWAYARSMQMPGNIRVEGPKGAQRVWAILGVSAAEKELIGLDNILVNGTFFSETDTFTCILGESLALKIGARIGESVTVGDMTLVVRSIASEEFFKYIIDLDQEMITPLDYSKPPPPFIHMDIAQVIIIPYDTARRMGGSLRSISLRFSNTSLISPAADEISVFLSGLDIYLSVGDGKITNIRQAVSVNIMGFEFLVVPTVIAVMVLFNMMLGTIKERIGDIKVFSSIGLSPQHVAGTFLIESIVYATVGGVLGYVGAISIISTLHSYNLLPADLPLNYTSSWIAASLGISILVMILSSLYPAYVASRQVTPSVERTWEIRTKPIGDEWTIPMPFIAANKSEVEGVFAFMKEYLEAHSMERAEAIFAATDIEQLTEEARGKEVLSLVANVRLAPWELGVKQKIRINAIQSEDKKYYSFELYVKRLEGYEPSWMRANRIFSKEIRKQLLIWQGLSAKEKRRYMKETSRGRSLQDSSLYRGASFR